MDRAEGEGGEGVGLRWFGWCVGMCVWVMGVVY